MTEEETDKNKGSRTQCSHQQYPIEPNARDSTLANGNIQWISMLKGAPKEGTASSVDGWLSYTKGLLCDHRPKTSVSLRPVSNGLSPGKGEVRGRLGMV